jgi:hypothetical protein
MLLNLNGVMSIIANVPAAIASTVSGSMGWAPCSSDHLPPQIVACRTVRRLTNYTSQGPEVFACVTLPPLFYNMNMTCSLQFNNPSLIHRFPLSRVQTAYIRFE